MRPASKGSHMAEAVLDVSDATAAAEAVTEAAPAAKEEAEEEGDGPVMREGAVVKGKGETRHIFMGSYCDGARSQRTHAISLSSLCDARSLSSVPRQSLLAYRSRVCRRLTVSLLSSL